METDYHRVDDIVNHTFFPDRRSIHIGESVWIGLSPSILKGVSIIPGCIIAANSVVTKNIIDENCMAADNSAIIKKHNVTRI